MRPRKVASVLMRRSLRGCWAVTGSKVNPRPAHLFMICSNIKLRWPEESIGIEICVFREQSQWDEGTFDALPALSLARAMIFSTATGKRHDNRVTHVRQQPQNPARRSQPLPRLSSLEKCDADRVRRGPPACPDHPVRHAPRRQERSE